MMQLITQRCSMSSFDSVLYRKHNIENNQHNLSFLTTLQKLKQKFLVLHVVLSFICSCQIINKYYKTEKVKKASAHTYAGRLQIKNHSTSTLDRTVHTYYNKKYIEASVRKRYYEWTISTTQSTRKYHSAENDTRRPLRIITKTNR